jgi:hypothetical protein
MVDAKKAGPTGDRQKAEDKDVDKALDEVQEVVDEETQKGYRGTEVDQTPNENYTVKGAAAGKPVPETQADPVAARREATNPDV